MVIIRIIFFICFSISICYSQTNAPLFNTIESNYSGITFANDIKENLTTNENLFDFDYFYNGAGVGAGDFNNDGLPDLVFSGNQKENELYINKGNFKFDLIEGALRDSKKEWSNGVSIVDINNDGLDDIYISQGGPHDYSKRSNLLYINQGDLTFIESAEKYGLNDQGISTQSAFFDYDKDGDLDCVVMNENSLYGLDPISFYQKLGEDENLFWQNSSHFYVNVDGQYIEATEEVGLLKPSFGLGLSIGDLNDDGWLDIYIANDYYVPDAMYMNQKDGTFSDEVKTRTNQMSFYGMGVDVADINNDSKQDIFVLDMASSDHYRSKTLMRSMNVDNFRMLVNTLRFPHQYMFNSLQLGGENGTFYNVSQHGGVAKTDWSWSVLMHDFDLDGLKDIFVTNGYRRYALDNDFQAKVMETKMAYNGSPPLSEKQRLYNEMPSEPLSNIMYKNNGGASFQEKTQEWGINKPSFSNGAVLVDLDGDGDQDLVINNIDAPATVLQNRSIEESKGSFLTIIPENPAFVKVTITHGETTQTAEVKSIRGYMSSSEKVAFFGVGNAEYIDLMSLEWPDGSYYESKKIKSNQILKINKPTQKGVQKQSETTPQRFKTLNPEDVGISFIHKENGYDDFKKEILLPYQQSTLGPNIVVGDLNNDKKEDLIFLGAAGQANQIYLQDEKGWSVSDQEIFQSDAAYEDMDAVLFDLNGDGWQDIYFVTGGNEKEKGSAFYEDRVYLNRNGDFERYQNATLDSLLFSGKDAEVIDFDDDGDDDLIIANRIIPQMFPYSAPSLLLENRNGELVNVTSQVAPILETFGIINDVEIFDFDGDGDMDIAAAGEWSSIGIFENENGVFQDISSDLGLDKMKGWWYSITKSDLNKDGKTDLILGNMGTNSKYTASDEKPLKIYGGDMDDNGTWDMVLSKKYKDEYVPFRGKECSTQQMPFISEKFPTYDLFASASIDDVYGGKLKDSYEEYANTFQSIALISNEQSYEIQPLSPTAQYFPILDGVSIGDEVMLAGNIFNTEVETPRMDMGNGALISFDKNDQNALKVINQGLNLGGNVKSLVKVKHHGLNKDFIIGGVNNESPKILELK